MSDLKIVHKRGMNNCGVWNVPDDQMTHQWKRINCMKCIGKGMSKIPKALLERYETLRLKDK